MNMFGQPNPKMGNEIVYPVAVERFLDISESQIKNGLEKYGTLLETWNGRNTAVDAMQELVDLSMYLTQLSIEKENLFTYAKALTDLAFELEGNLFDRFYDLFNELPEQLKGELTNG